MHHNVSGRRDADLICGQINGRRVGCRDERRRVRGESYVKRRLERSRVLGTSVASRGQ